LKIKKKNINNNKQKKEEVMSEFKTLLLALGLSLVMIFTAFAGQWQQAGIGWWYQNDDGSYPSNQWMEIDGKYYYFNENGYMLSNTLTSDGYYVLEDGAWQKFKDVSNPRFGFLISIPATWNENDESANGDGYFINCLNNKIDMRVFGSNDIGIFGRTLS